MYRVPLTAFTTEACVVCSPSPFNLSFLVLSHRRTSALCSVATLCVLETDQRLSMETGGKGAQASAERTPVAGRGARSSRRVLTQEDMAGNRRVRAVFLQ